MSKTGTGTAEPQAPDLTVRGLSFALRENGGILELRALHRPNYGAIHADWCGAELRRRIAAGKRQPLARAIGLHKQQPGEPPPGVLDANAGLGRDGYTLAALGACVTLAERNVTIHALLANAQARALAVAECAEAARRIELLNADARDLLDGSRQWDVIYLDPMYPDDGKAALPSKEMQILRDLTGGDEDADLLLAPAQACARRRVVVKRPLKAPFLGGVEPSLSLRSTLLRFDVYLTLKPVSP